MSTVGIKTTASWFIQVLKGDRSPAPGYTCRSELARDSFGSTTLAPATVTSQQSQEEYSDPTKFLTALQP